MGVGFPVDSDWPPIFISIFLIYLNPQPLPPYDISTTSTKVSRDGVPAIALIATINRVIEIDR